MDPKDKAYKKILNQNLGGFIMAYTEPYPVVTTLENITPTLNNYGQRVCYHYSLTLSEVTSLLNNLESLNTQFEKLMYNAADIVSVITSLVGCLVPILKAIAVGLWGFTTVATHLPSYSSSDLSTRISTFTTIKNHMIERGYNHFTVSQVLEYRYLPTAVDMITIWMPVAGPRVPDEGYYWK